MQSLKVFALVCVMVLASSVIGCGGPGPESDPAIESQSSALTVGTFHGSYKCGTDWWHVDQVIRWGSPDFLHPAPVVSISNDIAANDPASNAVQVECNPTQSSPFTWTGSNYYNAASIGPANCNMRSHRANQQWAWSATVTIPAGNLQLSPGSPNTWLMRVYDAGGFGNHDGLAACGGIFLVSLQ